MGPNPGRAHNGRCWVAVGTSGGVRGTRRVDSSHREEGDQARSDRSAASENVDGPHPGARWLEQEHGDLQRISVVYRSWSRREDSPLRSEPSAGSGDSVSISLIITTQWVISDLFSPP